MMPALPRRLLFAAPALLLAPPAHAVTLNEAALAQGGLVLGRATLLTAWWAQRRRQ
jgi:hypothetical protein